MKHLFKNIFLGSSLFVLLLFSPLTAFAASSQDEPVYTTLRSIDIGTFNEYRYKITEKFFELREGVEVNGAMNITILKEIAVLADTGYNYLPDNLKNKNYLNELLIDIQKGVKSPENEIIYTEIIKSIASFLEDVEIQSVKGSIDATPEEGNAPLTVTFRGIVQDPTGTQIPSGNYTWWIDDGGKKITIGRGPSLNYTFREEGKFSVFLDVTSAHRNTEGYTDVLPFRSRADIHVKEKIASLIVFVSGEKVTDNEELKFTPEEAEYGLIFDATSSTPTGGAKFIRTEWDFGNGVKRSYNGEPKIERVKYVNEGDYDVTLKMKTNEGKYVEREFTVAVHDPIAKIELNREDGYIGDKFTFSARSSGIYRDLTYNWEIIDIDDDKVIYQKSDKTFTYTFADKGKYNVQLKVRQSSGEIDQDTHIIYITSQAPIAEFESKIPASHKPNRVFFDASRSFDPDLSDDGKLEYSWYINGNRVNLEEANANGSVGYYTFASVGSHSVNLEVTDPDGITSIKKGDVTVDSILSVEMYAFPRVIQRDNFIKFVAESPEAEVFEWDFGDGQKTGGSFDKVTHTYEKSGTFNVKLKVSDKDNNSNSFSRTVYVSESDNPFALMDISYGGLERPLYEESACDGVGGYVVNRVQTIKFDAGESINIDGETSGLEYSWKIGQSKFSSAANVSHRFDEIGCFPVKLTVKSKNNGATHSTETMMDVRNVKPTLSSLSVVVENPEEDPLIVRVSALGAQDPDGVIQSYLWYYYTDIDSEPQDFRSTATSSTAFVIPKITGNYYFVAILKDNNESRVTSEEVTGARYFTTVTGDNINTPIVELSVDDNSTVIGEEITFTAKASNILGQGVEKDSSFSWDFDGDGFYDTQTSTPTTTYKYRKSGEFYAKVKVKHKGISSTKNITINVSNKLVPDFEYISIGNKFIFFDSSAGQVDSRTWDLGDGNKKSGTNFEHVYTDGVSSHIVNLKISEGTKVKEVQKTVTKNVKNILKTRGQDLVVFTSPVLSKTGSVVLETQSDKFFIYLGESTGDAHAYVIDYDIDYDSDLNGGTDDDEDNIGTASYISGDVIEIPLSPYMTQNIRVFLKDEAGNIIASEDINVTKTYIEDVEIDPDTIIFKDVTESEREKIEALKKILIELPQQQKLKALSFVQKLQENWNDDTEKTRTIIDFENYIFELALSNEDEIISLLESLLVEGQEDQSNRNITYQALVNLIPQEISCEVETGTCYDNLVSKLDDIKNSEDIEYNKTLGKEILEVIGATDLMDTTQKLDFKAILTSLVYGGDVTEIPNEEKQDIIEETENSSDENTSGGIMGIILFLLKIIGYFIAIFLVLVAAFYILYLIIGRKNNASFSEFVSKTTSFGKEQETIKSDEDVLTEDILGEIQKDESDILSTPKQVVEEKKEKAFTPSENTQAKKIPEQNTKTQTKDEVPDWLKGNFAGEKKGVKANEAKKEEPSPSTTEKTVSEPTLQKKPEPTKKVVPETKDKVKFEQKTEKKSSKPADIRGEAQDKKIEKKEENFDLEKDTKLPSADNVPDWLKGSFDDTPKQEEKVPEASKNEGEKEEKKQERVKENPSIKQEQKQEEKVDTSKNKIAQNPTPSGEKKEVQKEEKKDDTLNVPDWLKGSFDDTTKQEEKVPEASKNEGEREEKKQELTQENPSVKQEQKQEEKAKPLPTKKSPKKTPAKKTPNTTAKTGKVEDKSEDKKQEKKEELWDDGMKIPDWLKSDDNS